MGYLTGFELIGTGVPNTQANCPSLNSPESRRIRAALTRRIEFCSRVACCEVEEVAAMVTCEDNIRIQKA